MALRHEGGDLWTVDVRQGRNKRNRFSFHGTESEALVFEKSILTKLGLNDPSAIAFSTYLEDYLVEQGVHDSKKTEKERRRILCGPLTAAFGRQNPDSISSTQLSAYQAARLKDIEKGERTLKSGQIVKHGHDNGHRMVNIELQYLRTYVAWMKKKNYCLSDLAYVKPLRYKRKVPRTLSEADCMLIIENMEPMWRHFYNLIYLLGLRQDELKRMQWWQIDFRLWIMTIVGKGGKTRELPIASENARYHLLEHKDDVEVKGPLDPKGIVFANPKTGEAYLDIRKAIDRAKAKLGIGYRVTPHMFRHSFAMVLIDKGYDISTIGGLMGHNDIATTKIYLNTPSKKQMANALRDMDVR
jgi:site-specific recombinase XerD